MFEMFTLVDRCDKSARPEKVHNSGVKIFDKTKVNRMRFFCINVILFSIMIAANGCNPSNDKILEPVHHDDTTSGNSLPSSLIGTWVCDSIVDYVNDEAISYVVLYGEFYDSMTINADKSFSRVYLKDFLGTSKNMSGTVEIAGGKINLTRNGFTFSYDYILTDFSLVLIVQSSDATNISAQKEYFHRGK